MDTSPVWRVPRLWRLLLALSRVLVFPLARLRVVNGVPEQLRGGPIILVANHVSPFDPVVIMAACHRAGIVPRIMATGGVFRTPVVGALMRHCGHIRVDRNTEHVADALPAAAKALAENSAVLVYPEGRIWLDPWMWPERGKTGAARMAQMSGGAGAAGGAVGHACGDPVGGAETAGPGAGQGGAAASAGAGAFR